MRPHTTQPRDCVIVDGNTYCRRVDSWGAEQFGGFILVSVAVVGWLFWPAVRPWPFTAKLFVLWYGVPLAVLGVGLIIAGWVA